MKNTENKENMLFKELNIVFVYLFIFLVGVAIVLSMTSYLNNKVKEFNSDSILVETNK